MGRSHGLSPALDDDGSDAAGGGVSQSAAEARLSLCDLEHFWSLSLGQLSEDASAAAVEEGLLWSDVARLFSAWEETRDKLLKRGDVLVIRLKRLALFLPENGDAHTRGNSAAVGGGGSSGDDDFLGFIGRQRERKGAEAALEELRLLKKAEKETEALRLFDVFHEMLQRRCAAATGRTADMTMVGGEVTNESAAVSVLEGLGGARDGQLKAGADLQRHVKGKMFAFFGMPGDARASPSPGARDLTNTYGGQALHGAARTPALDSTRSAGGRCGLSCSHALCAMKRVPGSLPSMIHIQLERIQKVSREMRAILLEFLKVPVALSPAGSRTKGEKGLAGSARPRGTEGSGASCRLPVMQAAKDSSCGWLPQWQYVLQLRLLCEARAHAQLVEETPAAGAAASEAFQAIKCSEGDRLADKAVRREGSPGNAQAPPSARLSAREETAGAAETYASGGSLVNVGSNVTTVRALNAQPKDSPQREETAERPLSPRLRDALLETSRACEAILVSAGMGLGTLRALEAASSSGTLLEAGIGELPRPSDPTRDLGNGLDTLLGQLPMCVRALNAISRLPAAYRVFG
ncbi:hypothetical protein BESB_007560 [Besnoitia besnoiti]|uniref:Uncharacterized protein n=1 Tax=Besnoitia besnoiti TaxID=94643 RepID=A0A2A9MM78_BESBE|nr:hypothetical protein BESB_007560 [Besnoitia besnoiti]PFH38414.1 hypothetical protein BESB_007560 [Besnoitia besnoiti]